MNADLVAPALPWLAAAVPTLTPPLSAAPVPGGTSNPTFFVTDAAGRSCVLRRPPASDRHATAHDMDREYRCISALHAAGLPVPRPLAFATEDSPLGVPFYVMERVDGTVLRGLADVEVLAMNARARVGRELVATMARLHALDPGEVGLSDLGRPGGYLERQLHRWSLQAARAAEVSGVGQPDLERLHAELVARMPDGRRTTIVHGDLRLGNVIVDDEGRLAAVLDWELCTLGDPRADAAHMVVSWLEYGDRLPEGLMTPRQVADAYLAATGGEIDGFGYYVAFAAWRLASILTGVHARYVRGAGAGEAVDPDRHLRRIAWLAGLSRRGLDGETFAPVPAPR